MKVDTQVFFVEINHSNFVFIAGLYDDSQNFKIIEKIIIKKGRNRR